MHLQLSSIYFCARSVSENHDSVLLRVIRFYTLMHCVQPKLATARPGLSRHYGTLTKGYIWRLFLLNCYHVRLYENSVSLHSCAECRLIEGSRNPGRGYTTPRSTYTTLVFIDLPFPMDNSNIINKYSLTRCTSWRQRVWGCALCSVYQFAISILHV